MILADTSVWIEHLRRGVPGFADALDVRGVLGHEAVVGELALGSFARRERVLGDLRALPQAPLASVDELMGLIERNRLWGRGLGWVDVQLIASARLAAASLWTLDLALASAGRASGVGVISSHGAV